MGVGPGVGGFVGFIVGGAVFAFRVDIFPKEALKEDRTSRSVDIQTRRPIKSQLQELVDEAPAILSAPSILPRWMNPELPEDLNISHFGRLRCIGTHFLAGGIAEVPVACCVLRKPFVTPLDHFLGEGPGDFFLANNLLKNNKAIFAVKLGDKTGRSKIAKIPGSIYNLALSESIKIKSVQCFIELWVDSGARCDPPGDLHFLLPGQGVWVGLPG